LIRKKPYVVAPDRFSLVACHGGVCL
jgi:hypothetical protein